MSTSSAKPSRLPEHLVNLLPLQMRRKVERSLEIVDLVAHVRDVRVLRALGPSGYRGLILREGKRARTTTLSQSQAQFCWDYPADAPEMRKLIAHARRGQWQSDDLAWDTSVDPYDPEVPLLPGSFLNFEVLKSFGVRLDAHEQRELLHETACWALSQFLHGEQGALFVASQVTAAVPTYEGKIYGATQVNDEARHIEVFERYVREKLGKLYTVNDNLFVILDSVVADSRWDVKFLGMQIMVEGLALGAFSTLLRETREPLLRSLLQGVIRDEARHVHYGVLALRDHFTKELTERERREREAWAFEVALLMRDRFRLHEIYEERFEPLLSRAQWNAFIDASDGIASFRKLMFSRLIPNLREIGLLGPRIRPRYEKAGFLEYISGKAATELTEDEMLAGVGKPQSTPRA